MAFSSPFDIAERSADYWKRQLTLEETVNLFLWISLLNSCSKCLLRFHNYADYFGKGGVYGREWHSGRHSFLVEHPQQHFLKLRKPMSRYFLLIQLYPALKISEAGFQEHSLISNQTHSLGCKTNGELLQQPEKHHRVGFIHTAIVLRQWSEAAKLSIFVSLNLPLEGTDICPVEADFLSHAKLAQLACSRQNKLEHFLSYEKIRHSQKYEVELTS